jgi:hypothetical protein
MHLRFYGFSPLVLGSATTKTRKNNGYFLQYIGWKTAYQSDHSTSISGDIAWS